MWPCQYCGPENDETSTVYDNCGALRDDAIGDSGDNKDSEDLFFDDEGIQELLKVSWSLVMLSGFGWRTNYTVYSDGVCACLSECNCPPVAQLFFGAS